MKTLEYTFDTRIEFSIPVHDHYFVLRCQPKAQPGLAVMRAELRIEPDMRFVRQEDSFGNLLAVGCERQSHESIGYHSCGVVQVDFAKRRAQGAHPVYKYPTELTRPDGDMEAFVNELGPCGENTGAWCVRASKAVHAAMAYAPGATTVKSTAAETFAAKQGVCQDFSHILIAALRLAGVPARYVSGLALGEGQTHAWVEAHVGEEWLGLDPTRNQLVDETYIPLARGRDWSDCPIERGSFIGLADQTQTVFMTVKEVG